jgi:hypothetical protein
VKKLNLESHLLLHVGCDVTNIINNGKDAVLTNLKHPSTGNYAEKCADNRSLDPRTCYRAYRKFLKDYSVETLFKQNFVCYQAVIVADASYSSLSSDPEETKKRYHTFFKQNCKEFDRLSNKRKKIYSYIYSNEVSVDSIQQAKYRPHTHLIFFVPKSHSVEEQQHEISRIEERFNTRFSDRSMRLHRTEYSGELLPTVSTTFKEIETSVNYLFRAYSLVDQYAREARDHNIRELNKASVECYRNLVWLFKPSSNGSCVRHFRASRIPRKSEETTYKHPLLQKKKKSSTIKKA